MTRKTNTTDRAAAPPVRYRARDTSGHQAAGGSVDRAVTDLLASHRHRAVLAIDDLRIVRRPDRDREGELPTWFVYDSLVDYLDDDSDEQTSGVGASRWWAIVEEVPAAPAASPASEPARPGGAEVTQAAANHGMLTLDQCAQAAANHGIDLSCPRCASVFYTGHDEDEHVATCWSWAGQIPNISGSVENGLRFLQTRRLLDPASTNPGEGDLASCAEAEEAYGWIDRVLSDRVKRRALVSRVGGDSSR